LNQKEFRTLKFKWEDEYFDFSLGYNQLAAFESYHESQVNFH